MKKPIDKEYLEQSFIDFENDISNKKYLHSDDPSIHIHPNKNVLDKITESDDGNIIIGDIEFTGEYLTKTGDASNVTTKSSGAGNEATPPVAINQNTGLPSLSSGKYKLYYHFWLIKETFNNAMESISKRLVPTYSTAGVRYLREDGVWAEPVYGTDTADMANQIKKNTESIEGIQNNLEEVFQSVSDGKELIASAITDKGVDTDANDTFTTMAEHIRMISSGGVIIPLDSPTNVSLTDNLGSVILKWTDPSDTIYNSITFAEYAGTIVIRKEGSAPISATDGVIIVDSKIRNQYSTNGFIDDTVESDVEYYYGIFPYATNGSYNFECVNNITPSTDPWKQVKFSSASDEEISSMLTAHYNDEIDISNYWNVGDERIIHLSAMSADSKLDGESHNAQDVTLVIIDFNKDTLATSINGHTKAAITVNLKNCLNTQGIIDSDYKTSENNKRSFAASWMSCQRRTWCNTTFKNSLPTKFKSLIKVVKKSSYYVNYTYSSSDSTYTVESDDYFYQSPVSDSCFLLSPTEINSKWAVGTNKYENDPVYAYYEISSNQVKEKRWWLRKPTFNGLITNATPAWEDYPGAQFYRNTAGIAPAFCL